MTAIVWPRRGLCGACGRPAQQFPSGRWEHDGRPCAARTRTAWHIDDIAIKNAVKFVPDGEPLPEAPGAHLHPGAVDPVTGVPLSMTVCMTDHLPTVREHLARQAEETP